MYVHNGTTTVAFAINQVDSVTFYKSNQTAITDADGNVYTSVTIGTQEWMTENLRTSKYSDGTPISNLTGNTEWGNDTTLTGNTELGNDTTGAWCNFDNDNQHDTIYGKLYNWYAVETGKLCPTGWHVPTDSEWDVLEDYLTANGHSGSEGTALKSTSGWNIRGNGTDDYGFLGLPGGFRSSNGGFGFIGNDGYWWSSSQYSSNLAWYRSLSSYYDYVDSFNDDKRSGFSVRCLRD
jgi:uncharacterized protein (TIGR02145 family)